MSPFVRKSQFSLLLRKGYRYLWLTQITASLNDQLVRGLLAGTLVGLAFLAPTFSASGLLAGAWFVLPGLLMAPFGGQLADLYEPRRILIVARIIGLGAAVMAAAALLWQAPVTLYAAAMLGGIQEALFVPARGRLLRHELGDRELAGGCGLILAVVVLTMIATLMLSFLELVQRPEWLAGVLVTVAAASLLTSLLVPGTNTAPRRARSWSPLAVIHGTASAVLKDRNILLAVLGVGWFWFTATIYVTGLPDHAIAVFDATLEQTKLLMATPLAGIMLGALLCAPASGRRIELGLVPLGALLIAGAGIDFYVGATPDGDASSFTRGVIDLGLLGLGAGLFVTPLMAWIIQTAPRRRLGRVQGGVYMSIALFVAAGIATVDWSRRHGIDLGAVMLMATLAQAAVSIYIFTLLPEFLLRLIMWFLIHTFYRVEESGLDNVPVRGPAIIVSNHVSYLDALVIGAKLRRPVRFVMHKHIFAIPGLGLLFRLYKAIPIASGKTDPATLEAALDQVAEELARDQLVGIFPEGHLTHDGEIDVFRSGIEKMVARTPVPVVPVALQGLWGSFFSNCGGPALTHPPRLRWAKLGLVVGPPVPPEDVNAADLRSRVQALRGDRR
jgi:1-acyl-sn-glycerol-3-phosphate acyltransferase